ncbi:type VII secretion protein EssB/YukC [Neobacillus cucumis]|uniref:type VII secretion protein EssB/YukC n=1 Tax=Neobacillus cucumis TaxID=1740721 RepID=UPI0028532CA7|nr:type VII secretion protein EssB/YukC [Neobacillus cucumis]MDR4950465.1 type VII secretion protein EssB/YukC [Neobacillus cucumis]
MKIQLLPHGTLFIHQNKHYRLEIPANKVLAERREDLKDLLEESPHFFTLNDIKKENDRYILNYEVEEDFQPLLTAKEYSRVLRLALLNELLEMDPLNTIKEKVLIHPRNIFFKDMKTLKFLYRTNQWLPYDMHIEVLEQYKILIISMFSRFTYEKYKREKNNLLKKEKDEFLFRIENAESVIDLKGLISERLRQEETKHFFGLGTEKQRMKKQKRILAGLSMVICAGAFVLALFVQQSSVNKIQTAYAMELHKAQQESRFYKLLSEKKYDEAISYLNKNGGNSNQVAKVYMEKGEYQKAIDTDKHLIKPTIETLYKAGKKDEILGLEAESNYLEIEKKIVSYDYSTLLSMQAFVKDKDQRLRIGMSFAEHGDLEDAESLNQTLKNKELELTIRKIKLEKQAAGLEKQIREINEKVDVGLEDKQKELDPKNNELENIKAEIKKINKDMG